MENCAATENNKIDFNNAPPQYLAQPKMRMTRDELKQCLLGRLLEALYYLFPEGKVVQNKFLIGNIHGHAGESLTVELSRDKAGLWHDFATGEGGDILSLWGATHGWDSRRHFRDIVSSVQEWLGIPQAPLPQRSTATEGIRKLQPCAPQTQVSQPEVRVPETRVSEALGVLTGKWAYEDVDSNTLAWAYRYDPPKRKKEIRYQDAKTGQWTIPCPRPLYNQPGIALSDTVVLVEGEKCAAALVNMGICATTAMNGANAIVDKTDWSPLRGKHVTIWPDHDIPGKALADRLIHKLKEPGLEIASLTLVVVPEDKPKKWDVADAVAEGMDVRAFMDSYSRPIPILSEAGDIPDPVVHPATTPPLPLRKQLEKAREYPIEALGGLLGGAALDIHDKIQVPLAICGQSVLANAALVVQAHIDIRLPFGQISPTSLYMVSISESGGRKSVSDKEASAFIKKREEELRQDYDKNLASYTNAKDAHDALRRKILHGKAHNNQRDLEKELDALGSSPIPPLDSLLTVPEPTYEGICGYFMRGQPSIGLFSDEGGQFISGHGMNADNKIKTAAGLSNLWDGEPIKRMRGGDGTVVLVGKRLSIHLMIQPGVVEIFLSDPELLQQGLLSRFLVAAPDHLFGTRFSTNEKKRDGKALKGFNDKMLEIARKGMPINPENKRNELIPRVLAMTPEAEAAFYKFSDQIEARLKDGYDLENIRGFGSKLAEQASRIAAVIAFAEDSEVSHLQKHHFDRGATIAEYYAFEALRLFGNAFVPSYILEAESLLEWLKDLWPSKTTNPDLVSLPDVCIFGPNKLRRKEPAMNALKTLEDHGWLFKEKNGAVINEKHRKDVWRIRREYFDPEKQGRGETETFLPLAQAEESQPEESGPPAITTIATDPSMERDLEAETWDGINI